MLSTHSTMNGSRPFLNIHRWCLASWAGICRLKSLHLTQTFTQCLLYVIDYWVHVQVSQLDLCSASKKLADVATEMIDRGYLMLIGRHKPMIAFPIPAHAEIFAWRCLTRKYQNVQQMPRSLNSFIIQMIQRIDPAALRTSVARSKEGKIWESHFHCECYRLFSSPFLCTCLKTFSPNAHKCLIDLDASDAFLEQNMI